MAPNGTEFSNNIYYSSIQGGNSNKSAALRTAELHCPVDVDADVGYARICRYEDQNDK